MNGRNKGIKYIMGSLAILGMLSASSAESAQVAELSALQSLPQEPPSVSVVPADAVKVADQYVDFKLPANWPGGTIYVGANNIKLYAYYYGPDSPPLSMQCNWGVMASVDPVSGQIIGGVDPANGKPQACYIKAGVRPPQLPAKATTSWASIATVPAGAKKCADDFATCNLPSVWLGGNILYGAGNKYLVIPAGKATKPFVCHPNSFATPDPLPNVKKSCYYNSMDPTADLWTAIETDNAAAALAAINAGANLNFVKEKGATGGATGTPLFAAAGFCKPNVGRVLLQKGADPNWKSQYGNTVLGMAIQQNCTPLVKDIFKSAKISPDWRSGNGSWTVLHYAAVHADKESMEALLKSGKYSSIISMKTKDAELATPLHYAAKQANVPAVSLLIQHGADANAEAINGSTPMHYLARGNSSTDNPKWDTDHDKDYKDIINILEKEGKADLLAVITVNNNVYTAGKLATQFNTNKLLAIYIKGKEEQLIADRNLKLSGSRAK